MALTFEAIPGPPMRWWGLPLLAAMRRDYLGFSQGLKDAHGDMVRWQVLGERAVDLNHPELVREALVDRADALIRRERGPEVFAETSGQNVLVTEGDTWQRQRRMLMQAFTPRKVAGYAALMHAATDDALRRLRADQVVDMDGFFSRLTMDVILRALFGPGERADTAQAAQAVQTLSAIGFGEMFWPMTLPDWLPLPGKARKRRALRVLRELIAQGLAGPEQPGSLLAMLRAVRDDATGEALAPQKVFDQCMISFQAGHETTASALLWWAALMARHPEAQAQACAELDTVLAGAPLVPEQQDALPWLAASLKEAMRLCPPAAALMSRRTTRPVVLGGHQLPDRVTLRLTVWVLHHDPRWFPEPEAFRPDRFMPAAPAIPRGAYLPFGTGPRVCLGQHFAMLEMMLVAAALLQRWRLEVDDPRGPATPLPPGRMHVTFRPAEPVRLRLVAR
jgi:cytochrome P450